MNNSNFQNNNIGEIKASINPYEIVSKYVALEKSGDKFKGLCPFHQENTPSFHLDANNGLYYCFGCQAGGDVIKFLMEIEGWTFIETMRYLGKEAGIQFNERNKKQYSEKEKLFKANQKALEYYKNNLFHKRGENALAYLYSRGFTDKLIKFAELGFALPRWDTLSTHIKNNKLDVNDYLKLGLIKESTNTRYENNYYDQLRNRIVFPIKDVLGRTIGFGGRTIGDDEPKYLNSPENDLYHKSNSLYGIYQARSYIKDNDYAILAEGYLDVLALWQAGFYNTIASLGTAFSKGQANIIKRYTSNLIICYDGDSAGKRATNNAIEIMKDFDLNIKVAMIPDGLDPDDYIKKYGGANFKTNILHKAIPSMDFLVKMICDQYDLNKVQEKLEFATELTVFLSNIENRLEQAGYLSTYAEQYKLDKNALEYEMNRVSSGHFTKREVITKKSDNSLKGKILAQEKKLLKLMLDSKKPISSEIFALTEHKKLCELINENSLLDLKDLVELSKNKRLEGVLANIALLDSFEENETELIRQLTVFNIERTISALRKKISEAVKIGEDPTVLLEQFKKFEQERAKLYKNKDISS